jgi:hypothetical protein
MELFEYRITKYDPGKRDAQGRYVADEWTMYSQVGQAVGGVVLTIEEYRQTESAYINAVLTLLDECAVCIESGLFGRDRSQNRGAEGLAATPSFRGRDRRSFLRMMPTRWHRWNHSDDAAALAVPGTSGVWTASRCGSCRSP